MNSGESRSGSSASNSSSNFSNSSGHSFASNGDESGLKTPEGKVISSPLSSPLDHLSESGCSIQSPLKSNYKLDGSGYEWSDSSSDIDEDDDVKTAPKNSIQSSMSPSSGSEKENFDQQRMSPKAETSLMNRNMSEEVHIDHEDLSDVSDLESEKRNSQLCTDDGMCCDTENIDNENVMQNMLPSEEPVNTENLLITDLRQKLDQRKNQLKSAEESCETKLNAANSNSKIGESLDDLVRAQDEDALDFEAEEGECQDGVKEDAEKENNNKGEIKKPQTNQLDDKGAKLGENEELEEGEVSDEDEKRPEETEPKPVCRFYTRGQCTWGMSCRFLHPGVTDKGNYTMFDLVRPIPMPQGAPTGPSARPYPPHEYHDFRSERPILHHRHVNMHHPPNVYPAHHEARPLPTEVPVIVESAWERGLRTAKEMMRKANKRKEQDMDFEDKKMNLTLSPDELEKDPYYLKDGTSSPDNIRHGLYQEPLNTLYSPPERYIRGQHVPNYEEVDPYGRSSRYRELPPHRMPQYEDDRRVRSTREVIVQRVEPPARGDEWNDPWMRSRSPGGRGSSRGTGDKRRREKRSYSSNSSYSSSSSSQSDSSSDSSGSISPHQHNKRRYHTGGHKSPSALRRLGGKLGRSISPHNKKSRRSISQRRRANMSPSSIYNKNSGYSPIHKRKRISSVTRKSLSGKPKVKRHHSSSSSNSMSSDSSASDTETDSESSSSESTSRSRDHTPPKRLRVLEKFNSDRKLVRKVDPPKKRSPISIEIKKPTTVGVSALSATSPPHSLVVEKESKKSRREELLKQLRAVEDAIAKKRSKLS